MSDKLKSHSVAMSSLLVRYLIEYADEYVITLDEVESKCVGMFETTGWSELKRASETERVERMVGKWSNDMRAEIAGIIARMDTPKRGEAKMVQRSGSPGTSTDTLPFDQVTPHIQYLEDTRPEREARIAELDEKYPASRGDWGTAKTVAELQRDGHPDWQEPRSDA